MDLNNIIPFCKTKDIEAIETFIIEHKITIENLKISEIIEIPFQGNYNLDMVFSLNKKQPAAFFLLKAIQLLEYEATEELIFYNFEDYVFDNLVDELSFSETKEVLFQNDFTEKNCVSIIKLKDKDELTFLIETNKNYIFISEFYWKS